MEETTLLFRHLPVELSKEEKKDLLFSFGASRVNVMGISGRLKNTAFAAFPSKDHATEVLHQLHQADLLGSKLIVEIARQNDSCTPSLLDGDMKKSTGIDGEAILGRQKEMDGTKLQPREIKFDATFCTWGLKHPRRPELRYRYPPPSPSILTNIMNALVAVPKFYTQVLHLMNKMDLPAPFGTVTPAPPLVPSSQVMPDDVDQKEMEISESDETESEMESDEDNETGNRSQDRKASSERASRQHRKNLKKRLIHTKRPPRLSEFHEQTNKNVMSQMPDTATMTTTNVPIQDIFEQMPGSSSSGGPTAKKMALSFKMPALDLESSGREKQSRVSASTLNQPDVTAQLGQQHNNSQNQKRSSVSILPTFSTLSTNVPSGSMSVTTTHSSAYPPVPPPQPHHFSQQNLPPLPPPQHVSQLPLPPHLHQYPHQPDQHHLPPPPPPQSLQPPQPSVHPLPVPPFGDTINQEHNNTEHEHRPGIESEARKSIESISQYPSSIRKQDDNLEEDSTDETRTATGEGFGTIQRVHKVVDEEKEDHDTSKESSVAHDRKFISSASLRRGRLTKEEMQESSVFRRYDPGEASCRLYIKNVAKQATEYDLRHIYGRYVDWESEAEVNMFDIRLMKEGRMKGQAFVTMPSQEVATDALSDTNGYVLKDKALVVQFARSAKAQEDAAAVKT